MREVSKTILFIIGLCAFALICGLLHYRHSGDKESWSAVAASLAVLAAVIGVWPTLRTLELQEDALRPYPVPYIDSHSRYQLTQLRVINIGAGIAYDISVEWDSHPTDEGGNDVIRLDQIPVLLPNKDISTMLGRPWMLFGGGKAYTFTGTIKYKDAKGKLRKHRFTCSGHSYSKRLIHDEELPKTLRELQDIPATLEKIADAVTALAAKKGD